MINILKKNIDISYIIFFITSIVYVALVFGWYFKPPWMIDHLIYVHIANPENLADLNFWNNSGVSVKEGHHTERWAVLIPLMLSEKILFFLNPGTASQILHFFIYFLIFLFIFLSLRKINYLASLIFPILFVFAVHHTKNRATEVLADPYSILYLSIIALLIILLNNQNTKKIFFGLGFFITLLSFTKIHYGFFFLVLLFYYWIFFIQNYKVFILGVLSALTIMEIFLFLFLNLDIFIQYNINTVLVIKGYFLGGLGVGDGPGNNGWSFEWLKVMSKSIFMPFTFLIGTIFLLRNNSEILLNEKIFSIYTLAFAILIVFLSSLSSFPANDSYAYPIYIFAIPAMSIFLAKIKPEIINNYVYAMMIFFVTTLPLIFIYNLGGVKNTKFFVSFSSISIFLSLIIFPLLITYKKSILNIVLLLIIISFDIFWHNWKNIENHSWWRNGYNWHHQYLDQISKFNLEEGSYYVHFRDWPRIVDRDAREKMYIEPGIKSKTRKMLDVEAVVGDVEIDINKIKTHLITDFEVPLAKFELIDKGEFVTHEDQTNRKVYFYKRVNKN